MSSSKKLIQAAAGAAGGAGLDLPEVFSTYLYDGDGSTSKTITNGIDLSGEGGMVWIKRRTSAIDHHVWDTERGVQKRIRPNTTDAEATQSNSLTAFNSNGFTVSSGGVVNSNGNPHVAWTWRKAPKWFDILTYTGNSTAGRTISHNLGSDVGMVIIKKTNASTNWMVWHRSQSSNYGFLNLTNSFASAGAENFFGNGSSTVSPTSTQVTLGANSSVNGSGDTYVMYLFAHNNSDGEFGPDSDQDVIKCGSYTGDGTTNMSKQVDLGFEPQWLMIKNASASNDWMIFDNMRGISTGGNDNDLRAQSSTDEGTGSNWIAINATGFTFESANGKVNTSGNNYIYMAIRRGPLAEPENATDVFEAVTRDSSTGGVNYYTGFPVDLSIFNVRTSPGHYVHARLTADKRLQTVNTNAEISGDAVDFQTNVGYQPGSSSTTTNALTWNWRRAPSYFDVVCYSGTGSAQNITHNLGVTPEFYIVKRRDSTGGWYAYHKSIDVNGDGLPETDAIQFNGNAAAFDSANYWNDTAPTATTFTVGTTSAVNASGGTYVAYLFASLDGIAKVGGYTGNGSSSGPTVNLGFAPRFVFITKWGGTAGGGNKYAFDTERGIVAGNDPFLDFRNSNAEDSSSDLIDPDSNGFTISSSNGNINASGGEYMFYAIA